MQVYQLTYSANHSLLEIDLRINPINYFSRVRVGLYSLFILNLFWFRYDFFSNDENGLIQPRQQPNQLVYTHWFVKLSVALEMKLKKKLLI